MKKYVYIGRDIDEERYRWREIYVDGERYRYIWGKRYCRSADG